MDKICTKCDETKDVNNFWFNKKNNKHSLWCRQCNALYAKNRHNKKESAIIARNLNIEKKQTELLLTEKKCVKCNEIKNISNFRFRKRKRTVGVYDLKCKQCKAQIIVDSKSGPNKEKLALSHYESNKRYNKSVKGKLKNAQRTNSETRLRSNIGRSIRYILKEQKSSKNGISCMKYLSYTTEELKIHLESQFESWMSWNNYGAYKRGGERKWHIDHIIPQSLLPYNTMEHPNFQKSWALSNLRPLEAVENIIKGNKIIGEAA